VHAGGTSVSGAGEITDSSSHCKHQPFSASQGILQSPNLGYDSLLWQIASLSLETVLLITVEETRTSPRATGQPFYLFMSLLLAGITALGFSHTVPTDLAPPGLPVLLKFHAAIFFSWVVLFIAQPSLVVSGNIAMHRRLGWFGLALACAMVGIGTAAILLALRADSLPPFYPPGLFFVRGIAGLAGFAALIAFAILRRRRPDWHKRLMLCAAILIVVPGLERSMPVFLFGPHWYVIVDAVVLAIALIGPSLDFFSRRRIHPAYLYGVGAILIIQATTDLLAPTPFATALAQTLAGT